ncbi:MAG TPA: SIR2 family protein [Candidatus Fimimorpha faecalis]|uniref:SIR2 family protein n=1 Tax=Candidatus Fimimorpha faecalis TaxID=2840824 RepID=A0A9D1ECS8_9FIRM|nr:SIR2 family protein [Candidatus Fimimorpha faecalis]
MSIIQKSPLDINHVFACCPGNKKNFNYLISLIQKHVVIPFVGAGFSANFGYPGWAKFLKNQAEHFYLPEINQKLEKNLFEEAAGLLKEAVGEPMMEYIMLQEFGDHIYRNTSYDSNLEILPRLFRNLIITTNYDEVLEMLYAKVNGEIIRILTPQTIRNRKLALRQIARGDAVLIKLHGDVRERDRVLTKDEYDVSYGKTLDMNLPLPGFLRQILLSRIILFLGCSLEEDRTMDVIRHVRAEGSLSFALLPLPESTKNKEDPWKPKLFHEADGKLEEDPVFKERRKMLNKNRIIPIWYPAGEFEALALFLREVSYRVRGVYLPSTTQLRSNLENLLNVREERDPNGTYRRYMDAEDLIRKNEGRFPETVRLDALKTIKNFYSTHGWICERKAVVKDILRLTQRIYGVNSPEEALAYHDLGYTFERYHYYRLMLNAMLRADEILNMHERENHRVFAEVSEWSQELTNAKASVYISLGYAYLKNKDTDHAKLYYEKAKNLKEKDKSGLLNRAQNAFILNGLYRYYQILNDPKAALETLDRALEERQKLAEEDDMVLTQHIVNTHSNKIRVYLSSDFSDKVEKATEEYRAYENEPHLQVRLKNYPDARQRILTDYGDILQADSQYDKAVVCYQKALEVRNYLHMEDDFIACDLYLKISDCLQETDAQKDEALEYRIQAFLIRERLLGARHQETEAIWLDALKLASHLQYPEDAIRQRVEAQRIVRNFRYDSQIQEREEELIQYFEL